MTVILQPVIPTVYGAIHTWRAATVWSSWNCMYCTLCIYLQHTTNKCTIYL